MTSGICHSGIPLPWLQNKTFPFWWSNLTWIVSDARLRVNTAECYNKNRRSALWHYPLIFYSFKDFLSHLCIYSSKRQQGIPAEAVRFDLATLSSSASKSHARNVVGHWATLHPGPSVRRLFPYPGGTGPLTLLVEHRNKTEFVQT